MKDELSKEKPPPRRKVTGGTKPLGPVSNLEEHVRPDWWRCIFNSIYLKTDADVVDDQNITRKEVDYFSENLHLSPDVKILDLYCGQGRHSLELARREFKNEEGLDRSHYLIQKAKAKKEGFLSGSGKEMLEDYIIFPILSMLLCSWQQFRLLRDRSGRLTSLKGIFRV